MGLALSVVPDAKGLEYPTGAATADFLKATSLPYLELGITD